MQIANEKIFIQSRDNQSERGMGTTCTVASLVDDTLIVAQIGDSRCYILRDGKLAQVTKDQSLAWQLIEAGAMTADEAKAFEHANIILQALGVQERVEVVLSQVSLRRGDIALLCSDGLHGPVSDEEILSVLIAEPNLQRAGDALIQKALDRDGPDNITVVLGRFDGAGLMPPAPEDVVSFVGYDPGGDPIPEPLGSGDDHSLARETVEERLPRDMLTADDIPTKAEPDDPTPPPKQKEARRAGRCWRSSCWRSVAAATGGNFRDEVRTRSGEQGLPTLTSSRRWQPAHTAPTRLTTAPGFAAYAAGR